MHNCMTCCRFRSLPMLYISVLYDLLFVKVLPIPFTIVLYDLLYSFRYYQYYTLSYCTTCCIFHWSRGNRSLPVVSSSPPETSFPNKRGKSDDVPFIFIMRKRHLIHPSRRLSYFVTQDISVFETENSLSATPA